MFLLNNSLEFNTNKYSVILCNDKQILETVTYEQMTTDSETLKNQLAKHIKDENICLGLLMDHNVCIPSIILSLQKLKSTFIFLSARNLAKSISYLKLQWILSFEEVKEIPLFHKVDRVILNNKDLVIWNHCDPFYTNLNFQNVFCVVQTSGSTGENKLIRVTTTCIEINAANLRKVFNLKSEDVIFWGTSLTFDPSIIELILALQSGACLLIVPYKTYINPKTLYDALFSVANITFFQVVPSVFLRFTRDQIKQILLNSQLKILALGGENFPKTILCYERGYHLRIFNLYGISEVSCWATLHEITNESHDDDIPIGEALDATCLELRDEFGAKTSCGQGELFIGSSSRICYINEESSTETFGIVFRETGDIAEIKDNKIFLVGRKNKIVKRLGHRINLTKIENKIFQQTGLENVCIWSQKNTKLMTFILMKNLDLGLKGKILDKLRVKLINTLPNESFPDFIEIVTHFPLTSHGKVNEKSLEKLYSIPEITDSYENIFALLWCRYIGIATENLPELKHYKFFDLGGNSITAIQLLTEFKEITKCEYPHELLTMTFENSFAECMAYLKGVGPLKKKSDVQCLEEYAAKKRKMTEGGLTILWTYDLKACIDSCPLVFEKENKIYIAVGSFSHRFVVFQDDGQVVYEITLPDSIESTPSLSPCGKFLLIGCFNGIMYCMDFVNKKVVWKFATDSKIKSSACFCKERTAAIFGSYDKTVYCVSIMEGLKLWNTLLDGSISANPIYSECKKNVYIATTKGMFFCLKEEDGQILWKKSCGGPIFGTPCFINSDENIIVPTVQGILLCLQTRNGELLWKHQAEGHIFSSVVSFQHHILFGCFDKCINILNISDSKCVLVKKFKMKSEISSTPFISNAHGTVIIVSACNSGVIAVTDFSTFELLGSIQLPGEVFSSPFVYNDKIYVGCRDNNFYCIQVNK